MSTYAKPTDRPSSGEEQMWAEEAEYFRYREGNPHAPRGSEEARGWGIPPDLLPPPSAIEYVLAKYREQQLNLYEHDPRSERYVAIHPMYKWSFVLACMAHFLWFRTNAGANWVNRFFGLREEKPFYEGYAYFWVDPQAREPALREGSLLVPPVYTEDPHTGRKQLVSGVELRIFREWEKVLEPPCSVSNQTPADEMKRLVERCRMPFAKRELAMPKNELFFWVSEILRDWFMEAHPNKDWPTHKASRVVGWQWVHNLERAPNEKFYEALQKVALFKNRAYRLKDHTGGVYWCSGREIRIIPLKDLYLLENRMSEAEVDVLFRCPNCRKRKACTPATGEAHRCCHCYAVEFERGDRPTLMKCTMDRECKACPEVIGSHTELVELKNRLSRPARTGPVPR